MLANAISTNQNLSKKIRRITLSGTFRYKQTTEYQPGQTKITLVLVNFAVPVNHRMKLELLKQSPKVKIGGTKSQRKH